MLLNISKKIWATSSAIVSKSETTTFKGIRISKKCCLSCEENYKHKAETKLVCRPTRTFKMRALHVCMNVHAHRYTHTCILTKTCTLLHMHLNIDLYMHIYINTHTV